MYVQTGTPCQTLTAAGWCIIKGEGGVDIPCCPEIGMTKRNARPIRVNVIAWVQEKQLTSVLLLPCMANAIYYNDSFSFRYFRTVKLVLTNITII